MLPNNEHEYYDGGQKHTSVLPDFLIVGAQKAGTTTLYSILRQHSQIYMHPKKELHFFDRESKYAAGINYYASFFSDTGNAKAIGEATPAYLFLPEIPGRIAETLGKEVKIIIILRNPVARAFSQYRMLVNMGLEKRTLDETLNYNLQRFKNQGITFEKDTSYIDRGLYAVQLEQYLKFFPAENIRVFVFEEDLLRNAALMTEKIQQFLEVNFENLNTLVKETPARRVRNEKVEQVLNTAHPVNQFFRRVIPSKKVRAFIKFKMNSLNTNPAHLDADWDNWRERLMKEVYIEDISKTETLIGRDLSGWYRDFL
jgi:hypothetical protein